METTDNFLGGAVYRGTPAEKLQDHLVIFPNPVFFSAGVPIRSFSTGLAGGEMILASV